MRRKFKLKVSYTFNGCFTLRAASGKEAARLVSEQCGTVLSAIQTTLGEESEVDWHFDKHPRLAIREVIALPETLDGEKLPRVQVFHPGQRVFWRDPADETSGYYTVCSGNDDVEEPLTMTSSGFVLRLRKPKFFRANYVPYPIIIKDTFK